jgi:hypothetical protein
MARRIRSLLLVALAALLHGCYTSASLTTPDLAAPGGETGVVFGTIGVSSTAPTVDFSTLQFRRTGFHAQRVSEFMFHSPVGMMGVLLSPMFRTPVEFDEATGRGTMFVARLPAGDYQVVTATIANAPFAGWGAHVYETDAGSVTFHVEAGKATYLGQFLSHLRMGRDRDGIPIVTGAYFVVSNRLQRDLGLLATREPAFAAGAVLDQSARFIEVDNDALRRAPR